MIYIISFHKYCHIPNCEQIPTQHKIFNSNLNYFSTQAAIMRIQIQSFQINAIKNIIASNKLMKDFVQESMK